MAAKNVAKVTVAKKAASKEVASKKVASKKVITKKVITKKATAKKATAAADSQNVIKKLMVIPGVGKSIANDLLQIGIHEVSDLIGRDPEELFEASNRKVGLVQDRCLLYVFRCAVYFASTPESKRSPDKLLWWNWTDTKAEHSQRKTKR